MCNARPSPRDSCVDWDSSQATDNDRLSPFLEEAENRLSDFEVWPYRIPRQSCMPISLPENKTHQKRAHAPRTNQGILHECMGLILDYMRAVTRTYKDAKQPARTCQSNLGPDQLSTRAALHAARSCPFDDQDNSKYTRRPFARNCLWRSHIHPHWWAGEAFPSICHRTGAEKPPSTV
jgi:hypothetical protein